MKCSLGFNKKDNVKLERILVENIPVREIERSLEYVTNLNDEDILKREKVMRDNATSEVTNNVHKCSGINKEVSVKKDRIGSNCFNIVKLITLCSRWCEA